MGSWPLSVFSFHFLPFQFSGFPFYLPDFYILLGTCLLAPFVPLVLFLSRHLVKSVPWQPSPLCWRDLCPSSGGGVSEQVVLGQHHPQQEWYSELRRKAGSLGELLAWEQDETSLSVLLTPRTNWNLGCRPRQQQSLSSWALQFPSPWLT